MAEVGGLGVCELLAQPLPAIPAGATRGRSASAQKSALSRLSLVGCSPVGCSPVGCVPIVLEYSEPRWLPGVQEPKSSCGWGRGGVRAPRRGAVGREVTQARGPGPQFSRGSAHGLWNSRGAASIFTRAPLKIVLALGAEPEIAASR